MSNAVASQLIRHDLSWFAPVTIQQPLEETLGGRAVLVDGPPQILPISIYLHEHFVDEKRIAVPAMLTLQSIGVSWVELIAPQPYRFIAHTDTSFGQQIFDVAMTEIESMV